MPLVHFAPKNPVAVPRSAWREAPVSLPLPMVRCHYCISRTDQSHRQPSKSRWTVPIRTPDTGSLGLIQAGDRVLDDRYVMKSVDLVSQSPWTWSTAPWTLSHMTFVRKIDYLILENSWRLDFCRKNSVIYFIYVLVPAILQKQPELF
jgi:hypothetical protein